MREQMLKTMYCIYSDEDLSEKVREKLTAITTYVYGLTAKEENEELDDLLLDLTYFVFTDGANAVLDFISGKEINA